MNNKCAADEEQIAFENLYKKYEADIFLYATHFMHLSEEEAKDVTNEAFLKLLEIWSDFKPKTYPASLIWLRRTVQFLSYNLNRKKQRLPTVSLNECKRKKIASSVWTSVAYKEHIESIKSELTSEEYQLFEEIVIHCRDRKQLAKEMGITTNTLKVRWHRIRNKIKKILLGGDNGDQ